MIGLSSKGKTRARTAFSEEIEVNNVQYMYTYSARHVGLQNFTTAEHPDQKIQCTCINTNRSVCCHTTRCVRVCCTPHGVYTTFDLCTCVKRPQHFAPHNSTRSGSSDLNSGRFTLSFSNRFKLENAVSIRIEIFNPGPFQG